MLCWSAGGGTKTQAATEPTHDDDGVVSRWKIEMNRKQKKVKTQAIELQTNQNEKKKIKKYEA